jgi:hypothetical protein
MVPYRGDPHHSHVPDEMSVDVGLTVLLALLAYVLIRTFWA